MREFMLDQMKMFLANGEAKVTFIKKDGSTRVMLCTRNMDVIQMMIGPPPEVDPDKEVKADNPDLLKVFDMEVEDWRSFRLDSVKEFSVTLESKDE